MPKKEPSALSSYFRSTTFIHVLLTALGALVLSFVVLYGNDVWFSRDKGEELEKQQVLIEIDSKHRDEMIMQEVKHINEHLVDLKTMFKDYVKHKEGP